jgi:hypothetical protein
MKIRWISMLNLAKKVMEKCKTLLVKMELDNLETIIEPKKITNICLTSKSYWDFPISCHYWNLCMLWLNLHRYGMCLCATLWLPSRFTKVICIICIWNKVHIPSQITFGYSSPCFHVNMKTCTWSEYLILIWTPAFGLWGKWPTHMGSALWFGNYDTCICDWIYIFCCWITSEEPMQR